VAAFRCNPNVELVAALEKGKLARLSKGAALAEAMLENRCPAKLELDLCGLSAYVRRLESWHGRSSERLGSDGSPYGRCRGVTAACRGRMVATGAFGNWWWRAIRFIDLIDSACSRQSANWPFQR
jgi:hypothetical protein